MKRGLSAIMLTLNVAGAKIQIECKYHYILNEFRTFKTDNENNPDLKVKIYRNENITLPDTELLLDGDIKWCRSKSSNGYEVFFGKYESNAAALLTVDNDWSSASIQLGPGDKVQIRSTIKAFMELLFRNLILLRDGIIIHASAVKWQDRGILFTAPSGTGKSTQAELWKSYMGAEILNGDRPAIKLTKEGPAACGTPWSGLTPVFANKEALLSAIIILEQAPENSIRRLDPANSVSLLLPRCFLPYFDDNMMETAITTIEKILNRVPIYLLKCRPDKGAVELVHECVK